MLQKNNETTYIRLQAELAGNNRWASAFEEGN
jgi:hypothetical protein